MSDIKIELKGEDINAAIAEAITKSVLGDTIVRMVNEYVKGISTSYDNPVKKVIEAEVRALIVKLVDARRPEIEASVSQQLTTAAVERVISAGVEKLLKGY